VYDFHVVHGSGIEAISCQCSPEVGPSLVRSQQQWCHNTSVKKTQATCFKFTATEAGSAGPATIQFYYILLDHKVFYLNAICYSSLAPKSQKSPNQLQKSQNISVKQFSLRTPKAIIILDSYYRSKANSQTSKANFQSSDHLNHLNLHSG